MNITQEQALGVRCPLCGADIGERCELSIGLPRDYPHRDREWAAKDLILRGEGSIHGQVPVKEPED